MAHESYVVPAAQVKVQALVPGVVDGTCNHVVEVHVDGPAVTILAYCGNIPVHQERFALLAPVEVSCVILYLKWVAPLGIFVVAEHLMIGWSTFVFSTLGA